MPEIIQHGVLLGRKDTDFVAGVLPYVVVNPTGDWRNFVPPGERQSQATVDSMACVTFSALNSIETQEKHLTGKQPNYSDRWIAKMSGTTINGNYLYKVADAIRQYGLVLEEDYPSDFSSFDQYYADIPESKMSELLAKGKKWLEDWTIRYEWVGTIEEDLIRNLKQAPLQVVIPGHAIVEIRSVQDIMSYFDTYNPFIKQKPQNAISDALKILLTPLKGQTMSNAVLVTRGSKPNIEYGFFLPVINPSGLISDGLHHGIDIPKNPDGSVDFVAVDALVKGTITNV